MDTMLSFRAHKTDSGKEYSRFWRRVNSGDV